MRSVIWWIYYGLFLGLCIFIFIAVTWYGIRLVFVDRGKLNAAQILYGVAVGVMIFGLLSMSIGYLTRTIWHRIKGPSGKGGKDLALDRIGGDKARKIAPEAKKDDQRPE